MKKTLSAVALSALIAGATVPALAQMSPTAPSAGTSEPATPPSTIQTPTTPGTEAAATPAGTELHAGDLIGADVTNSAGESVGEVKDLVIGSDQKLSAAIVSVGGFLGVGDKLVSIALSDLQVTPQDDGDYKVLVSASKDELKAMPEVQLN